MNPTGTIQPSPLKRSPSVLVDSSPSLPLHRFSVAQYRQMTAAGVLSEADRVELLDGWIVAKMSRNPPHDYLIWLLMEIFRVRLSRDWTVRVQSAIDLPSSQPEPDLVVVRGPGSRYRNRHPRPRDVALIVEIAAASLDLDRGLKRAIYAGDRIPIYWVVDVDGETIEVFSQPRAVKGRVVYRVQSTYVAGDVLPLVARGDEFEGIAVADLFPQP